MTDGSADRGPPEGIRTSPGPGSSRGEGWWEALVRACDMLPDGVVVTDAGGRIVHVNAGLEAMSGYGLFDLVGEPVEILVPEAARALHRRQRHRYAARPRMRPMAAGQDLELRRRDGSSLPVDVSLAPLETGEGLLVLAAVRDASHRRRVLDRLRASEARYRSLVEHMPAVTYLVRPDGAVAFISGRVSEVLGYPPEQFEAEPGFWARVLHPEDRGRVCAAWRRAVETRGRFSLEYRCLSRDGRAVWVLDSSVPVTLGGEPFWHGVLVDVTARVRAEEELRRSYELLQRVDAARRGLTTELVAAAEAERIRMAADLHDGPIQRLSATVLRMELATRSTADPALAARLAALTEEARDVIRSLRRVVYEAHPPTLDRHGLGPAIREHLREAAACHGFQVELEDRLEREPSPEARTIAFRLFQEALTNVMKHAGARRVEVRIASREGGVWGMVRDDGVGFHPASAESPMEGPTPGSRAGIGLMRRRAELLGGWLQVRSAPGSGTTVEWWLPVGETSPVGT